MRMPFNDLAPFQNNISLQNNQDKKYTTEQTILFFLKKEKLSKKHTSSGNIIAHTCMLFFKNKKLKRKFTFHIFLIIRA